MGGLVTVTLELLLAGGAVWTVLQFADESQQASGVVAALALAAVVHLLLAGSSSASQETTSGIAKDGVVDDPTAPEHQVLLVGCSGAGKTVLFRQLGLAFGPGSS